MKNKTFWGVLALSALSLILIGCSTAGSPGTAFERKFFDVHTNTLEVTVLKTNMVPITTYATNQVVQTVTNLLGVTEYKTNVIVVPKVELQTVTQWVTSSIPSYQWALGTNANTVVSTGTAVGNLFGVGGLVGTGLAGLLALWARIRSGQNYATAANTAQVVETMRSFIQQLPNGASYDAALVQWMQAHQAEAGVLQNVISLLQNTVNKGDAQEAARQIKDLIAALQGTVPPKS